MNLAVLRVKVCTIGDKAANLAADTQSRLERIEEQLHLNGTGKPKRAAPKRRTRS